MAAAGSGEVGQRFQHRNPCRQLPFIDFDNQPPEQRFHVMALVRPGDTGHCANLTKVFVMTLSRHQLKLLASFLALYLIWGSTYFAISVAVAEWPPFLMAGVRFVLAGLLMYGYLRWRGAANPSLAELKGAAILGVLMPAIGNGFVTLAQKEVSSGVAALVVAPCRCLPSCSRACSATSRAAWIWPAYCWALPDRGAEHGRQPAGLAGRCRRAAVCQCRLGAGLSLESAPHPTQGVDVQRHDDAQWRHRAAAGQCRQR